MSLRASTASPTAGVAGVVEREDVRVAKLRSELYLSKEAVAAERFGEFRSQHLERDIPVVPQIVREVYGRHAANAELALDRVAAGE
jgi:hypothetical protein